MKRATDIRQATSTSSRIAASRRPAARARQATAVLAGSILTALALAACAGGSPASPGPDAGTPADLTPSGLAGATQPATAPPAITRPGTSTPGATSSEDPAVAAMKQTVTDSLGRLAAGTPKPATEQVTDALTGAGIAPAALEVSASRTPTGLEADAIEAAVLQGTHCVVGHIRDGNVTVTVLPVLATGKCFVGAGA